MPRGGGACRAGGGTGVGEGRCGGGAQRAQGKDGNVIGGSPSSETLATRHIPPQHATTRCTGRHRHTRMKGRAGRMLWLLGPQRGRRGGVLRSDAVEGHSLPSPTKAQSQDFHCAHYQPSHYSLNAQIFSCWPSRRLHRPPPSMQPSLCRTICWGPVLCGCWCGRSSVALLMIRGITDGVTGIGVFSEQVQN